MNLSTNKFFNSTDIHVSSRMNEYLKKNFGYEVEGDLDTLQEAKKSLEAEQVTLKKDGYMNQKYMENMLMIETIGSLLKAHGKKEVNEERVDEIIPMVIGGIARAAIGGAVKAMAKGAAKGAATATTAATSNSVNASTKSKGKKKLNAVKEGEEEVYFNYEDIGGNIIVNPKSTITDQIGELLDRYYDISPMDFDPSKIEIQDIDESVNEDEEKGPDHYRWKNDSQLSIAKDRLEACMKQLDHAIQYRAENSHLLLRGGDKAGTGDLYDMKEKLEKIHDSWEKQTEYYGM